MPEWVVPNEPKEPAQQLARQAGLVSQPWAQAQSRATLAPKSRGVGIPFGLVSERPPAHPDLAEPPPPTTSPNPRVHLTYPPSSSSSTSRSRWSLGFHRKDHHSDHSPRITWSQNASAPYRGSLCPGYRRWGLASLVSRETGRSQLRGKQRTHEPESGQECSSRRPHGEPTYTYPPGAAWARSMTAAHQCTRHEP